jgi:glyoxylase-like metal-dependent hydrolase (beta-lactamase superfamily II)
VDEVEPGLTGVGIDPAFAIGQRALLLQSERLLWDCAPLLGGGPGALPASTEIETIAISHPHYYSTMVDWAERFDARILLHEADREWIMRPSPRIQLWSGDALQLAESVTLIRLGGHFPGGTVCLWSTGADGRGALLSGDIVQVVEDRDWASFMWSYPNLIPLPARAVQRMRAVLAELEFDRVYGAWWERVMRNDARSKVLRSADRYVRALS